ncbi:MAG: ABC-2 family transporter protein [Acidobacteriota bacterium]
MHRLAHYLKVYRLFLATSFSEAMSFRAHFVLLVVMDLLFYGSALGSVGFVYEHVKTIGPWSRDQFLFFVSFMLAVDHLHMTFVSESFWMFSADLRSGLLDFVLLKPIGAIFSVFFRHARAASLCNVFVPWACLIHFGRRAGLGVAGLAALPPLVVLALTLMVSLEILLSTSMFWLVESMGINFLRMQLQQVARMPDFVYRFFARKLFTVVFPVLLVGSAPVRFLFDPLDARWLLGMAAAVGASWLAIAFFWRLGLRAYESASS